MRSPDLIILGGRPSMGKTQVALSFIKAAAQAGKQVLLVSLEMIERQLGTRYLLEDERIDAAHLHSGRLSDGEWEAIEEQIAALQDLPVHVATHPGIRFLQNIRSEARRLKRSGLLDLLVIDYLGLMQTGRSFNLRYQEIGYITGELKNLAKELDIPILLICQLNRLPKGVGVRPPQMDDLRESGDIEQDADLIIFVHKPDYYQPSAVDSFGRPWAGRGKLIIAKQREGIRNTEVIFCHDARYKKIGDMPFG